MQSFKKLIFSLVTALSVTILIPAAIPFMPETHGIEIQAANNLNSTVYVTPTGKKYHVKKCGRGTFRKAALSGAKSSGLTACKKCY